MTHRGPFQPLPFCDSVSSSKAQHRPCCPSAFLWRGADTGGHHGPGPQRWIPAGADRFPSSRRFKPHMREGVGAGRSAGAKREERGVVRRNQGLRNASVGRQKKMGLQHLPVLLTWTSPATKPAP